MGGLGRAGVAALGGKSRCVGRATAPRFHRSLLEDRFAVSRFWGRPNFLASVKHWPRVRLLLWSWTISRMLWRAVIGTCWMMAECSAICARATANCTRANGGFVSCARVRQARWSSPPTVGPPVFASIRLKKSPSIISCLARRSCHSEQPDVTSRVNFARTGTFRSPEHLTSCRRRRHRA